MQQSDTPSPTPSLTPVERLIAPLLPSICDIFFIGLLFGGVFALQGRVLGVDGDAGWTLRLGQIILTHGLPRAEPLLSQGPGQAPGLPLGGWLDWEWLAQLAYALAYRLGGLNGLVALAASLIAFTLISLLEILRRHGASLWLALAVTVAALPLVAMVWSARAQLFSLPLALWWGEWLWRYWRDGDARRWLWRFPLAMALWANLHGGFLWGLLLLGLATTLAWALTLARRWLPGLPFSFPLFHAGPRALSLAFGASLLATLATPWGIALPIHVLSFAQNPLITQYTQEYQSPDFHLLGEQFFLLLLFLLIGAWLWAAARHTGQPEPLGLTICGAWTLLTFLYVRSMSVWPLLALPYLVDALVALAKARAADRAVSSSQGRPQAQVWFRWGKVVALLRRTEATDELVGRFGLWRWAALLLLAALLFNGGRLPGMSHPALDARFNAQAFPVAAVARLRATGLPPGRGFNTYEWGGYLEVALPNYHPFIDSRSDSYSEAFLHDYLVIISLAPGWRGLLDRYDIAWALLPSGAPLAQVLAQTPPWRCRPADLQGVAALCVRPQGAVTSG